MLYTIGDKTAYLKAIKNSNGGAIIKIGKANDYDGGYVFESIEDAQKRIDEAYSNSEYGVFGIETVIENTSPAKNGWWRTLNTDAKIIVIST